MRLSFYIIIIITIRYNCLHLKNKHKKKDRETQLAYKKKERREIEFRSFRKSLQLNNVVEKVCVYK